MTETPDQRINGPLNAWLTPSQSPYLVLHRTLMQSMPTRWQHRLVACLQELDAAFDHVDRPTDFDVTAVIERPIRDLSPHEASLAGNSVSVGNGRDYPGPDAGGRDVTNHDAPVAIPTSDPIPHYRRGYVRPSEQVLAQIADLKTDDSWAVLDGPVHAWFSLSYASYLVLHRTLVRSMPLEWQRRFVDCLQLYDAAFDHIDRPSTFDVEPEADPRAKDVPVDEAAKTRPGAESDDTDQVGPVRADHRTGYTGSHVHAVVPASDPALPDRVDYLEPDEYAIALVVNSRFDALDALDAAIEALVYR